MKIFFHKETHKKNLILRTINTLNFFFVDDEGQVFLPNGRKTEERLLRLVIPENAEFSFEIPDGIANSVMSEIVDGKNGSSIFGYLFPESLI